MHNASRDPDLQPLGPVIDRFAKHAQRWLRQSRAARVELKDANLRAGGQAPLTARPSDPEAAIAAIEAHAQARGDPPMPLIGAYVSHHFLRQQAQLSLAVQAGSRGDPERRAEAMRAAYIEAEAERKAWVRALLLACLRLSAPELSPSRFVAFNVGSLLDYEDVDLAFVARDPGAQAALQRSFNTISASFLRYSAKVQLYLNEQISSHGAAPLLDDYQQLLEQPIHSVVSVMQLLGSDRLAGDRGLARALDELVIHKHYAHHGAPIVHERFLRALDQELRIVLEPRLPSRILSPKRDVYLPAKLAISGLRLIHGVHSPLAPLALTQLAKRSPEDAFCCQALSEAFVDNELLRILLFIHVLPAEHFDLSEVQTRAAFSGPAELLGAQPGDDVHGFLIEHYGGVRKRALTAIRQLHRAIERYLAEISSFRKLARQLDAEEAADDDVPRQLLRALKRHPGGVFWDEVITRISDERPVAFSRGLRALPRREQEWVADGYIQLLLEDPASLIEFFVYLIQTDQDRAAAPAGPGGKTGSEDEAKAGSEAGAKAGSEGEEKTGSKAEAEAGAKAGSGAEAGAKAGSGAEAGAKTGSEGEEKTGSKVEAEAGAKAGSGAGTGAKAGSGAEAGAKAGSGTGAKTGSEAKADPKIGSEDGVGEGGAERSLSQLFWAALRRQLRASPERLTELVDQVDLKASAPGLYKLAASSPPRLLGGFADWMEARVDSKRGVRLIRALRSMIVLSHRRSNAVGRAVSRALGTGALLPRLGSSRQLEELQRDHLRGAAQSRRLRPQIEALGQALDVGFIKCALERVLMVPAGPHVSGFVDVVDLYIRQLFVACAREVQRQHPVDFAELRPQELAIFSTGGYGRGESFGSDWDYFALIHSPDPQRRLFFGRALQRMSTAMARRGLSAHNRFASHFGAYVGTVPELLAHLAERGPETFIDEAELLEARLLFGDPQLGECFQREVQGRVVRERAGAFIQDVLSELAARRRAYGALRANPKSAPGGLREIHLVWLLAQVAAGLSEPICEASLPAVARALPGCEPDLRFLLGAHERLRRARELYRLTVAYDDVIDAAAFVRVGRDLSPMLEAGIDERFGEHLASELRASATRVDRVLKTVEARLDLLG